MSGIVVKQKSYPNDYPVSHYQIKLKSEYNKVYDSVDIKDALDSIEYDMLKYLEDKQSIETEEDHFEGY